MRSLVRFAGITGSVSGIFLLVIMLATDPSAVPSWVLLLVFLGLFCLVFALAVVLLLLLHLVGLINWQPRTYRRLAVLLAGAATFLVILQSIGQLTPKDITIGALFAVLLYVYYVRLQGDQTR